MGSMNAELLREVKTLMSTMVQMQDLTRNVRADVVRILDRTVEYQNTRAEVMRNRASIEKVKNHLDQFEQDVTLKFADHKDTMEKESAHGRETTVQSENRIAHGVALMMTERVQWLDKSITAQTGRVEILDGIAVMKTMLKDLQEVIAIRGGSSSSGQPQQRRGTSQIRRTVSYTQTAVTARNSQGQGLNAKMVYTPACESSGSTNLDL